MKTMTLRRDFYPSHLGDPTFGVAVIIIAIFCCSYSSTISAPLVHEN